MAEIKPLLIIILLVFLISLFHILNASCKPAGFSLKLTRAYSPVSSLSHRNNTFRDVYESYVHASEARASYWTSFNKSTAKITIHPDVIQPPLTMEGKKVVVEMRIGGPPQKVFLLFDTGGTKLWTQCDSCTTCFPQSWPKFDPQLSGSYREMSSDDPNCKPPLYIKTEHECHYESKYINNQYTKGIASYDIFSSLDNNFYTYTGSIRFGCSLESGGVDFPPNTIISGILGMSRDSESFASQVSKYGGKGRFSYCLVDMNTAPTAVNKVTFGDDIPSTAEENIQTVPFIRHSYAHGWAINLLDISVGEERLNLPPTTFAPNPQGGNGGLLIDTGSEFTYLTSLAYLRIKAKIMMHISKRPEHFTRLPGQKSLCYRYDQPSRQLLMEYLQTITFHLENGVEFLMPVTSVYLFIWNDNVFCLGMLEAGSDFPNILGSMQQQDTRFVYDSNENSLSFNPETCAG